FFFQAEDGIRDRNVTGVQTCALPICEAVVVDPERRVLPSVERLTAAAPTVRGGACRSTCPGASCSSPVRAGGSAAPSRRPSGTRSEERRVGKGCRSWWDAEPETREHM